jgi:hypothetical protein
MTKDGLIARQQLKLEYHTDQNKVHAELKRLLIGKFYNIGQPLNDNILQFNPKQQRWAWDVVQLIEQLDFSE